MKIVIDIPKGIYEMFISGNYPKFYACDVTDVLKKGTVLPKGHGRLIDADAFANKFDTNINGRIGDKYIMAPTIIEADGGDAE